MADNQEQARSLIQQAQALLTQATELLAQPSSPISPLPSADAIPWGAKVSPAFRAFVKQMALDFPPTQPGWYMACMAFETGRSFSPKVKNPGSSATGLIQFMDATAAELKTTTAALAKMTAEKQLEYVWYYFRNVIKTRGPLNTLGDCYMAILNPVAIGKPDDYQMWIAGSSAYAANAGLDANKDHVITKAEAAAHVYALLTEGSKPENLA